MTSHSKSSKKGKDKTTENRKLDHIRICLEREVQSSILPGFHEIQFIHAAAPEIDLDDVDVSCTFLGHKLNAPLMVTAMTGGHRDASSINQYIAEAVETLNLAMGVGSQRAAIEDPSLADSFSITRESAPSAFLVANIGAPQLSLGYGVDEAETAIKMIKANALAIHFNAAQEAVQPEGDVTFSGVLNAISRLANKTSVPLIAKETGAGISREIALKLSKTGIQALDVAGLGGTSWPAVEVERAKEEDALKATLGRWFTNWGIPTAVATYEVAQTVKIPLIASGGVRTGIDIAKAIALGADVGGMALPILPLATINAKAVTVFLEHVLHGLKAAMFLVSARNIKELRQKPIIIGGATRNWLELRGYDIHDLANRHVR